MIFDKNADKTLQGAEDCAVKHYRYLPGVILSHKLCPETLRHGKIQLQGAALPDATDTVLERKLYFRPVERALTGLQFPDEFFVIQRGSQRLFRLVPLLLGTYPLCGTGGKFYQDVIKAKIVVNLLQQIDKLNGLILHLGLCAEDVSVVLSERSHPHDPVQRTGGLVTVTGTEFRESERQV